LFKQNGFAQGYGAIVILSVTKDLMSIDSSLRSEWHRFRVLL